jgi:hypothetical protein
MKLQSCTFWLLNHLEEVGFSSKNQSYWVTRLCKIVVHNILWDSWLVGVYYILEEKPWWHISKKYVFWKSRFIRPKSAQFSKWQWNLGVDQKAEILKFERMQKKESVAEHMIWSEKNHFSAVISDRLSQKRNNWALVEQSFFKKHLLNGWFTILYRMDSNNGKAKAWMNFLLLFWQFILFSKLCVKFYFSFI